MFRRTVAASLKIHHYVAHEWTRTRKTKAPIKLEHKLITKEEWDMLKTKYSARNVFLSKYFKQRKHNGKD